METIIGQTTPGSAAKDLIKDATEATFMADVIEASAETPILVDFWADWCEPCKQLTPVLEKLVLAAAGRVKLVKVNADACQQIVAQLRVQSLPTVMAFKDGQAVDGFQGALPESQIKEFLTRLVGEIGPSPVEQLVAQGLAALETGDTVGAIQALGQVVETDPRNIDALAGLARALTLDGNLEEAGRVLEVVPPEQRGKSQIESAVAGLALAREAADAGDVTELAAAVEAAPDDIQARFDLALALAANGRDDDAAAALLHIIAVERDWNEDAARQQLVKMFEAAGPTAPFTQQNRRKLSSLLFS